MPRPYLLYVCRCLRISPFHFCTGLRPICTFAPVTCFPLSPRGLRNSPPPSRLVRLHPIQRHEVECLVLVVDVVVACEAFGAVAMVDDITVDDPDR